jgi:hypothetical protein
MFAPSRPHAIKPDPRAVGDVIYRPKPKRQHPAELVPRKRNLFLAFQDAAAVRPGDEGIVEVCLYVDEYDDVRVGDAVALTQDEQFAGLGRVVELLKPRQAPVGNRHSTYRVNVKLQGFARPPFLAGQLQEELAQLLRRTAQKIWRVVVTKPAEIRYIAGGLPPDREIAIKLVTAAHAFATAPSELPQPQDQAEPDAPV